MTKTGYLTGPPPVTQAEIDAIERRCREYPPGSEAEQIWFLQDEIQYLLASPEEAKRIEEEWQAETTRLQAYNDWLKAESGAIRADIEAIQQDTLAIKQWILERRGPEHLAHLEREFELQGSIERGNHKKTANLTIVMSPTLRSSLEKIAQRHRVTIAAWARDVLHHAALEYYPESRE